MNKVAGFFQAVESQLGERFLTHGYVVTAVENVENFLGQRIKQ